MPLPLTPVSSSRKADARPLPSFAFKGHPGRGDEAYNAGEYRIAKDAYLSASYALVGDFCKIPMEPRDYDIRGIQWTPYTTMDPFDKVSLMYCYSGLSKCSMALGNLEEALIWLDEARFLALSTRFALPISLFEWIRWNLDLPQLTKEIVKALALSSDVFATLGNTGTAADRRWNTGVETLDERHLTPEVKKLRNVGKLYELISLRHPDPSLTATVEVKDPELQVLGSWKKVSVRRQGAMKPRLAFASFIWNGKLYVGGGMGETKGPFFRDLCCLDLKRLDTWRALPPFPGPEHTTDKWMCWSFAIYDDKAFLFTGKEELDYFDLRSETWHTVMTSSLGDAVRGGILKWAPLYGLKDSTQHVIGHHLYVFGGTHKKCLIGCNIFLQLDFKTMKWRRLSGYMQPGTEADYTCPGPRKTPSSWVDETQGRIFLFGGECDRTGAEFTGELHGADCGYAYEDLWSWDIRNEKWRMERMRGNAPCPRSEAACTYNGAINMAVVFGGYNPALGTQFDNNFFPFSYFADTFIYCSSAPLRPETSTAISLRTEGTLSSNTTGKWKHVLTRGFPTYRYVNTDWVPSGKANMSRTFADLWQLRIDTPGGFFEDVDIADEAKTAKVGPWQRCFACGSAGRWKKCGGSCKGRAFFCDSDCLREGWKQHKVMHGCRKVT
ncbi:hypothetical protein BDZ97DRAFT_1811650 [Flammula alnicola]|nr:hypothetical protein BDZ97DRAFT_1811650 [Flammula alnicola]